MYGEDAGDELSQEYVCFVSQSSAWGHAYTHTLGFPTDQGIFTELFSFRSSSRPCSTRYSS